MLPRTGLGDEARLAHAPSEQRLPQRVVDLVGAGVGQVLALEPDLRPTTGGGQAAGEGEGRGAPYVVAQERGELGFERRIGAGLVVGVLQLFERGEEGFGHIAPAVGPVVAPWIGQATNVDIGMGCGHSVRLLLRVPCGGLSAKAVTSADQGCGRR